MSEEAARTSGEDWGRWLTAAGVLLVLGCVGLAVGGWAGGMLGSLMDARHPRPGLEGAANGIFGMLAGAALGAILGASRTPVALRWLNSSDKPKSPQARQAVGSASRAAMEASAAGTPAASSPLKQKLQIAAADLCLLVVCTKVGSRLGASLASAIGNAPALKNGLDFWLFGLGYNLTEYSQWAGAAAGLIAGIAACRHYNRRRSSLNSDN